jgi:hypothetical protein
MATWPMRATLKENSGAKQYLPQDLVYLNICIEAIGTPYYGDSVH